MATYVANVQHKDERWPVHSHDSLKMAETRAYVLVSSLETSSSPTYNSGPMFIGILESDGKTNSFLFQTFIEYLQIHQTLWSMWCRRRRGTKPLKNKQQCKMVHIQYKGGLGQKCKHMKQPLMADACSSQRIIDQILTLREMKTS